MRALLNGVLSYGLMNVPVGVCTANKRKDFEFRTLHKKCGEPVNQTKVCVHCQVDNLQPDELVRGFEFTKKNFVVLDSNVLEGIASERSKVIAIQKFVPWDEVDELQVERSYYLAPSPMLTKPYQLLSQAMGAKEAVGLGSSSLWGKEYPSMVWAKESGALVLSMLYCHDEVVSDSEIIDSFKEVSGEEQNLANEFVAVMMRGLDPEKDLVSHTRRRINEYIASVVGDKAFEPVVEVAPEPTLNIMQTLRDSIEVARSAA